MDIKYLLLYFEENYGLTIEKKIQDAVMVIANENRYHPVRDFLNALQWDGTERIRYCLHRFLGADADDYTLSLIHISEKRKYQSEATTKSRQKMKAAAEAGDPDGIRDVYKRQVRCGAIFCILSRLCSSRFPLPGQSQINAAVSYTHLSRFILSSSVSFAVWLK